MKSNFLRNLTFLGILSTGYCQIFTVHENPDPNSRLSSLWGSRGGLSKNFTLDEDACITFNFYKDKISSIDTHGGCVKVWEHGSCSGESMIVTERSGCSRNFAACDKSYSGTRVTWNDRISSVSICSRAEETKANRPIDNGDLVQYDMLLVNSNNAKTVSGDSPANILFLTDFRSDYSFVAKLCKHIDCKRQETILVQAGKERCANFGGDWDREVSALFTLYDCVEMFDGNNCTGESIKFSAFHGPQVSQQGDSCRRNLSGCGWNDRIRSMRNCAY